MEVVVTGRHRLGGGEEKSGRGNNRVGVGVGFGFRRSVVKCSNWVKWSGLEWGRRVNPPRMTTGRKRERGKRSSTLTYIGTEYSNLKAAVLVWNYSTQ